MTHSKVLKTFLCFIKAFFSCHLEMLQHLWSYHVLGSLGVYQEALYFYSCVIDVSLLSLLI